MKRLDQIAGLAVVDAVTGKRLGRVIEPVLDAASGHAAGVSWKPDGVFRAERYAQYDKIMLLGQVSMLLADSGSGGKKPIDRLRIGQKVYLTDGSSIGWFTNALLDEADGAICMLEVSKGYVDDLDCGRVWLSSFSWSKEGIVAL